MAEGQAARRARPLSPRARLAIWVLIAVGLVGRVILAFKTYGVPQDIGAFQSVYRHLVGPHPFAVYSAVNGHPYNQWPYPPVFLGWIFAAGKLAAATGAFHGWIKLPQVAADCAMAWLVQDHLGRRGASERARLAAAALIAIGPSFWMISGYHGQIDSLAILPAVVALWSWDRSPPGLRRAIIAGVLIGIGTAIKDVPVIMLFALLPSARSNRERAALVGAFGATIVIALAPYLVAEQHGFVHALRSHRALPGFGGISLLAQPDLANIWLHQQNVPLSSLTNFLLRNEPVITGILLLPFVLLVVLRRVPPTAAACLLWLALPIVSVGFGFEYVVWTLPFALMAGYLWPVAVAQAALLLPAGLGYWHPFGHAPTLVYVPAMIIIWCAAVIALGALTVRLARAPRTSYARSSDGREMVRA